MEAIIEHSDDELAPEVMSIADRLEARGEARGRAEGRAEMLLEMLEHRFGRLPHAVQARVLGGTVPQLGTWALRLLDASTLDEVWGDP